MWRGEKVGVRLDWVESAGVSSQCMSPGICCPISDAPGRLKHSVSFALVNRYSITGASNFEAQELANS
jgi:hypothetical protein